MLFKSAGSKWEFVCLLQSVCNSEQHFVRTIALKHACLPCLLHANKPAEAMRVPRVSDGCSSCNGRLCMPHTINIQNIETICIVVRGMIVSLWLCIAFRLSRQRCAIVRSCQCFFFPLSFFSHSATRGSQVHV